MENACNARQTRTDPSFGTIDAVTRVGKMVACLRRNRIQAHHNVVLLERSNERPNRNCDRRRRLPRLERRDPRRGQGRRQTRLGDDRFPGRLRRHPRAAAVPRPGLPEDRRPADPRRDHPGHRQPRPLLGQGRARRDPPLAPGTDRRREGGHGKVGHPRPGHHRRRRIVEHRPAVVRGGRALGGSAQDHRQRPGRHHDDLRVRLGRGLRHRRPGSAAHHGREPQSRHGAGSDGPLRRLDRPATPAWPAAAT